MNKTPLTNEEVKKQLVYLDLGWVVSAQTGCDMYRLAATLRELVDRRNGVTYAPCVVCGAQTPFACSDCAIDSRCAVHVCASQACRARHEETCPGKENHV
jgi:hypothetical protein